MASDLMVAWQCLRLPCWAMAQLGFIGFTRLPLGQLPDASTLCRFRNRLFKAYKLKALLDELDDQL